MKYATIVGLFTTWFQVANLGGLNDVGILQKRIRMKRLMTIVYSLTFVVMIDFSQVKQIGQVSQGLGWIGWSSHPKLAGHSVRCVKDE